MRRVWSGLLLLLAVVVFGAAAYVIGHNDPVPNAGGTAGVATVSSPAQPAGSAGTTPGSDSPLGSGAPSGTTSSGARPTVAFLGDNYTAGDGASPGKSWVSLVEQALDINGSTFAVSGGGYAKSNGDGQTYRSLINKVVADKPTLVVVSGGRNDTSDDPQTLADDARSLFATLHRRLPDATLVALAPWWGDSPHPPELGPVDSAVKHAVRAAGGTYLNLPDPLHNHPHWMADAANPNDQGHAAIAAAVTAALRKYVSG